jgi:hypothetical protein
MRIFFNGKMHSGGSDMPEKHFVEGILIREWTFCYNNIIRGVTSRGRSVEAFFQKGTFLRGHRRFRKGTVYG